MRLGVDDVLGLLGERRVQRDEIGAPEQLVELDLLDAEIAARAPATGTDRRRSPSCAGRCARSATIEPILPQPMTPSVLPVISTPMKRFFSHLPAWVEASACGIWRASASISVIACSAVVIELPNGVFITMMPLAVAAGMSTLSTPMPARPITLRFFACSRIFGVTLVAERIARPSKSPIDLGELVLVRAELGLEIDLDAAILEDLHGGGRERIGDENLGAWHDPVFDASLERAICEREACAALSRAHRAGDGRERHAAFGSASLVLAKAQSSHGVSASTSARSTVAPHQMRRPGGASR